MTCTEHISNFSSSFFLPKIELAQQKDTVAKEAEEEEEEEEQFCTRCNIEVFKNKKKGDVKGGRYHDGDNRYMCMTCYYRARKQKIKVIILFTYI